MTIEAARIAASLAQIRLNEPSHNEEARPHPPPRFPAAVSCLNASYHEAMRGTFIARRQGRAAPEIETIVQFHII